MGYHMTFVKSRESSAGAIASLVQQHVSTAEVVSDVAAELTMLLPKDASSRFPPLFAQLESERAALGIESYGVSVTTMEEVFLKVAEGAMHRSAKGQRRASGAATTSTSTSSAAVESRALLESGPVRPLHAGLGLRFRQLGAMLRKRYLHTLRNRTAIATQLVLPLAFALAAICVAGYSDSALKDSSRLLFSLRGYGATPVRAGDSDTAGDLWSFVGPDGESMFASLGGAAAGAAGAALPTALLASTQALLQDDSRFSNGAFVDVSAGNLSDALLVGAADYTRTRFFKKNVAALGLERGPYYVRPNAGGSACELWDGTAFVAGAPLQLALSETYRLALDKASGPDASLSLRQASSAANPAFFDNNGRDITFSTPWFEGLYAAGSTGVDGLLLHLDSNSVSDGTQLFVHCDATQSATPLTITVTGTPPQATDPGTATVLAYYSEAALHAAPQSLNLAANAMARTYLGNDARIYAYNHPLPATASDALDNVRSDSTGFQVALFLVFAGGFLMASFALFIVAERVSKAKHIQFVSGINAVVYWSSNLLWDLFTCLAPAAGVIIIFAIFDVPAYRDERMWMVFAYFMLFVWAAIPLVYCMQHAFKTSAGAYSILSIVFILGGVAMLLGVWITDLLEEDAVSDVMRLVFYIVPNYTFGQVLFDMFVNSQYGKLCDEGIAQACNLHKSNYASLSEPGVGLPAVYLFLGGFVWFLLLLLGEAGLLPTRQPKPFRTPVREDESDVAAERRRVLDGNAEGDRLVVKDLTKVYYKKGGKGRFVAVDGLSFGVPAGECFGLLGVNGAGKTTTFTTLTGELRPTRGSIHAAGHDLLAYSRLARRHMGYCPQYDALIGLLVSCLVCIVVARTRNCEKIERERGGIAESSGKREKLEEEEGTDIADDGYALYRKTNSLG